MTRPAKIDLRPHRIPKWQASMASTITWKQAPPFLVNPRAILTHRVKSAGRVVDK